MQKEEFDAEITRLASLELIDYCRESKEAAKHLGITKRELDHCVKAAKRKLNAEGTAEPEPEKFTGIWLEIGSDLEIARLVINDMFANMNCMSIQRARSTIGPVACGKKWMTSTFKSSLSHDMTVLAMVARV